MGERVVGFCNFCEVHGPRIVFVCQESSSSSAGRIVNDDNNRGKIIGGGGKQCYGDLNSDLGPTPTTAEVDGGCSSSISAASSSAEYCDGCRAFATSKPVYLTNDHKSRTSFVTCQYPYRLDVFSRVRYACVRSLSCEACPGRQGPILFSDGGGAGGGYCLCYVFTLKDSKARGFRHSYSIVVVSRRLDELLGTNYSVLVAWLRNVIVAKLQSWSDRVFDREGAESADRLPQIAASGRAGWVPSGFFLRTPGGGGCSGVGGSGANRRLATAASPRSLAELTDRGDVFKFLHDAFVDLHRLAAFSQAHAFRGFVDPAYSLPLIRMNTHVNGDDDTDAAKTTVEDSSSSSSSCCHICSDLEGHHHEPTNLSSSPPPPSWMAFKTLSLLYDVLGSEAFSMLAYHVLIGNQVVVRSACICLNRLLLDALKLLLPAGCVRCVDSCSAYKEPWECNLVGLLLAEEDDADDRRSETTPIDGDSSIGGGDHHYHRPRNGGGENCGASAGELSQSLQNFSTDEGCVILCVETPAGFLHSLGIHTNNNTNGKVDYWRSTAEDYSNNKNSRNSSKFRMFCASPTKSGSFFDIELPAFLQSLLHLLSSRRTLISSKCGEIIYESGSAILESLKDEWMRKAKLYYAMSKMHRYDKNNDHIDHDHRKNNNVDHIDEEESWRKLFFRVAKCKPNDEPLLKFWRAGLDRRFKKNILARGAARYYNNHT